MRKKLEDKIPPEGTFFVFEFTADYTDGDGSALAFFKVNNQKLETEWHPCDHAFMNSIGERQNEEAIKYLKQNKIGEVWTLGKLSRDPNKFLGLTLRYESPYPKDDTWYIYEELGLWYWQDYFKNEGIKLEIFDAT